MSALAIAHPRTAQPSLPHLRPVPDLVEESPVTVTISIAGDLAGRNRVLAALRDLVDAVGPDAEVDLGTQDRPGGEIRLDPRARAAQRGGQALELSRLEYDLLLFLARHPRQVFSRTQLLSQVWGHRHTTNRTVDVHVSRLRSKLDDPELITTVYGMGYRLADDAPVAIDE